MWNHQQPHLYDNITQLEADMVLNRNFAKEHGISVDSGYSIGKMIFFFFCKYGIYNKI